MWFLRTHTSHIGTMATLSSSHSLLSLSVSLPCAVFLHIWVSVSALDGGNVKHQLESEKKHTNAHSAVSIHFWVALNSWFLFVCLFVYFYIVFFFSISLVCIQVVSDLVSKWVSVCDSICPLLLLAVYHTREFTIFIFRQESADYRLFFYLTKSRRWCFRFRFLFLFLRVWIDDRVRYM